MPRGLDARIGAIAAQQHGLVTRTQVLSAGGTQSSVRERLRREVWKRVGRCVYRLVGAPGTFRQSVMAAVLTAGPRAVASHRCAGLLWELDGFERRIIEVTVPRDGQRNAQGVIMHSSHRLPKRDITTLHNIPVTAAARTIVDLCSVSSPQSVEVALHDARRRRLLGLQSIRTALRDRPRLHGTAALWKLIDDRGAPNESVLELAFARLLRARRLPRPVAQFCVVIGGRTAARLDFAYPDHRIAIEIDSYQFHSGRMRWTSDLSRQNLLTRNGWLVLRFCGTDLANPDQTVDIVRDALRLRSAQAGR